MNRIFISLFFFFLSTFLCAAVPQSYAQVSGAHPVVTSLPQQFSDGFQNTQINYYYFGGEKVYLPFVVNNVEDTAVELKAELSQLSFSLQVPYDVLPEIVSSAKKGMTESFMKFTAINLPEVKRETVFELLYKIKQTNQEQWKESGQAEIRVYPRDILKPFENWSKKVQLRLKDREGIFAEFLENSNIEFVDYRAALPKKKDLRIVSIVVGDPGKDFFKKRQGYPNESIIMLREEVENIPGVIVQAYKTGVLVDVHLKLIDHLANDPRNQKMLVNIIQFTNY